uniref:Uncharacterized protein n=1 Tax=viral metagenome TaxID=1070528 RepID=A0A6C0BMV7_9ZZZZ
MALVLRETKNNTALGEFLTRIFQGHKIKQRASDGFVDATAICTMFKKRLGAYNATKSAVKFKTAAMLKLNTSEFQVISTFVRNQE